MLTKQREQIGQNFATLVQYKIILPISRGFILYSAKYCNYFDKTLMMLSKQFFVFVNGQILKK